MFIESTIEISNQLYRWYDSFSEDDH